MAMLMRKPGFSVIVGVFSLLAVIAAACPGGSGVVTTLSDVVKASDSLSDPPGSCVAHDMQYPIPDGKKWYPLSVTTAHANKACPQRNQEMVELRGWVHGVDGHTLGSETDCNAADPDWHINLEVDTAWATQHGIDLNTLFRVGNLYQFPLNTSYSGSAVYHADATPLIHLEIWGWEPAKHPNGTAPKDWKTISDWTHGKDTSTNCPTVLWPYNPRHPFDTDLTEGNYVRVVGSLVTDASHNMAPAWNKGFPDVEGYPEDTYKTEAQKVFGGESQAYYDSEDAPARWTEVHPPDLIVALPDPGHTDTVRGVALFAGGCVIGPCGTQIIDEDLFPPAPCAGSTPTLRYEELVGRASGETVFSSIIEGSGTPDQVYSGAKIAQSMDHIHVKVAIQGSDEIAGRKDGRFKAIYRVYCAG
jgi:hypothetical protein